MIVISEEDRPVRVAIYVAVSRNGVIGKDGDMPWRLSSDLKRFKARTMGKPVIMGRKTWEGLPRKPLPGRTNIVVTRQADYAAEGALVRSSLAEALEAARHVSDADEICVIGGGQIYAETLPRADLLHVTHVQADVEGDTTFGPIDPEIWQVAETEDVPQGERDSHPVRFCTYRRRAAAD